MATSKKTTEPRSPKHESDKGAPPPFEASIQRLTKIVDELERGDLDLERSLELFEEGVRLARASQARLDDAEQRVEELLAIDETGAPVVRDLESEFEE